MKIAYILYPEVIISNRSNGVRSQAVTWAKLLSERGHSIDFIDNWGDYDWKSYDIIHLFGGGKWVYPVSKRLSEINANVVWSSIMDPCIDKLSYFKLSQLRMLQNVTRNKFQWGLSDTVKSIPFLKSIFTRSEFEGDFLVRYLGFPREKIIKVPLSYSESCLHHDMVRKEPFCLHISSIFQERKNVLRLINSAKKYQFELVLAGNMGSDTQFKPLKDAIGCCPNIKVLGFISEEDKINLYKRAKVFALPSLNEGVGIVALDAAYYGCEIVITDIPGPKEYYNGMAREVNPYDVDEIGNGIMDFIEDKVKYQPMLSDVIEDLYSPDSIIEKLESSYKTIMSNK